MLTMDLNNTENIQAAEAFGVLAQKFWDTRSVRVFMIFMMLWGSAATTGATPCCRCFTHYFSPFHV